MRRLIIICLLVVLVTSQCKKEEASTTEPRCNLHKELCNKRYDEVSCLTAHNAFNYKGPFQLPNQNYPISWQLEQGVRGFMIDIYSTTQGIVVYHVFQQFGTQKAVDVFTEVNEFMDNHPHEIVTFILENNISNRQLDSITSESGLIKYVFTPDGSGIWPTLKEMAESSQRLVVFVENKKHDPNPGWILTAYDYMYDTGYSHEKLSDFDCEVLRGSPSNDLFLLNHWISTPIIGTGDPDGAKTVNKNPFLGNRVKECSDLHHDFVNFVALDFVDIGDGLAVVDSINGVE